jgi:hypothetical protein
MNNFEGNLRIYFGRHCLHYINVVETPTHIGFMDLSHSLRCLMDVKTEIDDLYDDLGIELKFKHQANRRKGRKSVIGDEKTFDSIVTDTGTYYSYGHFSRTLTDDELLGMLNGLSHVEAQYENRKMSFTEWLAVEVGSIENGGNTYRVSREDFIRRIANKFGGSHPHETKFNMDIDRNQEMINCYVDRSMTIKLPSIERGYLLVKEFSEDMIRAILPNYYDESNTDSKDIFSYCYKLLNH